MTSTTFEKRELDHKSWLNEIERWKYDLGVWDNYSEKMKKDAQAVVVAVEQFIESVKEQRREIDSLKKRIVECERGTVEHKRSEEDTKRMHEEDSTGYRERHDQHKRLEQQRHELMALLATLKIRDTAQVAGIPK